MKMTNRAGTTLASAFTLAAGFLGIFLGISIAINPANVSANGRLFFSILLAGLGLGLAVTSSMKIFKIHKKTTTECEAVETNPTKEQ